jgi:hypothetical protein
MTPRTWARQDPADLLAAIPGMADGRVIRPLADGPTNATYLVEHAGEPFVLRLDKAETRILGLDRHNERTVCAAVAAAGLGPAYRHFDPAAGVCLRPFITGRCLQRADLADLPALINCLAGPGAGYPGGDCCLAGDADGDSDVDLQDAALIDAAQP